MNDNYTTSNYITSTVSQNGWIHLDGQASWGTPGTVIQGSVEVKNGITPELYFKYIKRKFGVIEEMRLNARLKKVEKAFLKAVDNGQNALGEKLLRDIARETRESVMFAKGIRHFIENDDLARFKNKIRGGHISDTKLADFTRVIPEAVLAKKKKVEALFDGFVIYHYWDEKAEKNRTEKQKMTVAEKSRMRDPVLFGVIRESNRLYFIADWEDELCDLTFEEMVDVMGKDDEEHIISREPKLT